MTRQQELALLIKLCRRLDKDAGKYKAEAVALKEAVK